MLTRRDLLRVGLVIAAGMGGAWAGDFFGLFGSKSPAASRPAGGLPWPEAQRIVAETAMPAFPDATFVATDGRYGAVGDGLTNNTAAFRRAIEDCSSRGGGHVLVPPGVYSTGGIQLLSKVDLHLDPGAVLRFDGNPDDYPLVLSRYEGIECVNHSPMVYAYAETDVGLTGEGVLDASDTVAWNVGSNRAILEALVAAGVPPGDRVVPHYGRLRSAFVEPYRCANVLVQGVKLRQSQFWQLHPTLCRNVHIDRVTTGDTARANTDGCDIECCDQVVITNCRFDANDDCIALKSGRDEDGRQVNTPCQNVVISGCRLQGPAGGIACGSEMTGGVRNIYVFDCETHGDGVRHVLFVKSNTRRGGSAENIYVDSVRAQRLGGAWGFAQMDYDSQTGTHRPIFRAWNISHASGDFMPWVFQLGGLPDDHIASVHVTDSDFSHVFLPLNFYSDVDDVRFERVTINGRPASA